MNSEQEYLTQVCTKEQAAALLAELKQTYEQLHPYKQCNVLWEMLQAGKGK